MIVAIWSYQPRLLNSIPVSVLRFSMLKGTKMSIMRSTFSQCGLRRVKPDWASSPGLATHISNA